MTSPHVLARSAPRRRPIAFATLAALLFIVPAASGCSKNSSSEAPASPSDPVIPRVNGVDITQGDLALAEEDMGGDLGYFTKDQMVPEFADVAFKMYPGQLSNPVKTQFGFHVIKVEDRHTKQPPEFDKVKDQIEAYLVRKAQTDFIAKLRQNAKVERLDKPAEQKKN